MHAQQSPTTPLPKRMIVGVVVLLLLLLAGLSSARAGEIVPSIGMSRATDGGAGQTFLGLEMRGNVAPMVKIGLGVGYRSEEMYNGDVKVRIIPVTASVWASPVPMFYAGGGIGEYVTAVTYKDQLLIPDASTTVFGAHLGGGMSFPLAPVASIDLQGRYVYMRDQDTAVGSGSFNPSFWNVSAGVAIKF